MLYDYTVFLGPPQEPGEDWTAFIPQVSGVYEQGETIEEAVANVTDMLLYMLAYYKIQDGEFPPWKPVEDFQDRIDLLMEGEALPQRKITVDWDDAMEAKEKRDKEHNCALIITRFFRSVGVSRS